MGSYKGHLGESERTWCGGGGQGRCLKGHLG